MGNSTVKVSRVALQGVLLGVLINIAGCAEIAHNSVPAEEKKHGKQEVSERQQVAQDQNTSTTQSQAQKSMPNVDCATLADERRNIYFKSPGEPTEKMTAVKVGATGYGAPPKNYYPEGQRRLMTIRASKIDAYRALAESVGGLHVWGGSAIGDMVIERDRYRVFIDSFVRGAHVVSVEAMEDDTYKTIVEMEVDQRFLNHVMTFINPAADRYCYEQEADGSMKYFGYSVAPSFYYSE